MPCKNIQALSGLIPAPSLSCPYAQYAICKKWERRFRQIQSPAQAPVTSVWFSEQRMLPSLPFKRASFHDHAANTRPVTT